jgi:probable addiction module antidote protein
MTTKKKRRVLTIDYKELLFQDLQDLDEAAGYLTAALEEGEDVFLLAIRDVAQAHGGMTDLSKATDLNRENLYDMLSKEGNPRLSSLTAILDKLSKENCMGKKQPSSQ